MPFKVQSNVWRTRAEGGRGESLLLVHGIGDSKPGGNDSLLSRLRQALGPRFEDIAVYSLYYDILNDWASEKFRMQNLIASVVSRLKADFGGDEMASVAAEFGGDIISPILSSTVRQAVRAAYILQLQEIVADGIRAGFPQRAQKLHIICHSLGCFHTYEALHLAASDPALRLTPVKDGVRFRNVLFMASPVQLIRSVAGSISGFVPDGITALKGRALSCPVGKEVTGGAKPSVANWISITGTLDPVGGHLLGKKQPWAYMNVPAEGSFAGQVSRIDDQSFLNIRTSQELRAALWASLRNGQPTGVAARDPHSWGDYIDRNAQEIKTWLTA